MLEIRYDPIKNQRVAYATRRQNRTFHPPKDFCPLCPTKVDGIASEIPEASYNIVVFENKFPTFSKEPDEVDVNISSLYRKEKSRGICEVICYSKDHDKYLEDQSIEKIENLIKVWADRYYNLGKKDFIKYVFIFENKGKEIGVTLSHPHGQIYAFSYIPPMIAEELRNSKKYFKINGKCIHCKVIEEEIVRKDRIVIQNKDFIAFIPYYARWPYEVHIYSLKHKGSFCDFNDRDRASLARILKELINQYNKLFDRRMSYIMVAHQNPTDGKKHDYYHFHFEFFPPNRTKDKLKYLAGCELGAGTFINDTLPEEKAKDLRNALKFRIK